MAPVGKIVVTTFGGLHVALPDGRTAALQTHRTRALFVLLLLARDRPVHREILCNQLWPDLPEASARSHLRKALWRIRSAIEPAAACSGAPVLRVAEHLVGLDPTQISADCWRFADALADIEHVADRDLSAASADALATVIAFSGGLFAAGLFDDWCLIEQETMRQARIDAIEHLVGYHRAQEQWLQAVHWAQKGLLLDPAREDLHRAIMTCRYAMGDRTSALRQYQSCVRSLAHEFGIAPSDDLRALRAEIAGPCSDAAGRSRH